MLENTSFEKGRRKKAKKVGKRIWGVVPSLPRRPLRTQILMQPLYALVMGHWRVKREPLASWSIDCTKSEQVSASLWGWKKWFLLSFLSLFFNWSITSSQCCVAFSCTATWISVHKCPLPLEPPSLLPSHPSRSSQRTVQLPLLYSSFPIAVQSTHGSETGDRCSPPQGNTVGDPFPVE